jgi:hypothetical protein
MNNASGVRPYFFWDYDLSEEQTRDILRSGSSSERLWVITRILEYAKWEDIWRYLSVNDIRENLALIPFRRPQDRDLWAYALERWAQHD